MELSTMAARIRWIIEADYADEGPLGRLSVEALTALAEALEAAGDVALHEQSDSRWLRELRTRMMEVDRWA